LAGWLAAGDPVALYVSRNYANALGTIDVSIVSAADDTIQVIGNAKTTKPLVPNTTDENRAKNRRVELKRAQCRS
jgi:outer membrane protein OmpA-like peptidoglycan-associated protein